MLGSGRAETLRDLQENHGQPYTHLEWGLVLLFPAWEAFHPPFDKGNLFFLSFAARSKAETHPAFLCASGCPHRRWWQIPKVAVRKTAPTIGPLPDRKQGTLQFDQRSLSRRTIDGQH